MCRVCDVPSWLCAESLPCAELSHNPEYCTGIVQIDKINVAHDTFHFRLYGSTLQDGDTKREFSFSSF